MNSTLNKIAFISLYFIIAIAFRYYITVAKPDFFTNAGYFSQIILQGIGPFIGGLLMIYGFKRPNDLKLFSFGVKQSVFLVLLPILLFTLVGVFNIGKPYYIDGPKIVIGAILYGFLEEYGWRGYLQTELKNLTKFYKYLIIAILWYVWHLELGLTINHLVHFGIILSGTIGIGFVADRTKSFVLVTLFHAFLNLFYLTSALEGITAIQKIVILTVCIVAIINLMRVDGRNKRLAEEHRASLQ